MKRSDFFRATLAASLATTAAGAATGGENMSQAAAPGPLPRRPLGRTGDNLSVIGFGGIVVMDETQEHANELVREAWDAGVNYYDVAPTYGDAELKLGPALEPYRKQAFLACKTVERDAAGSFKELETSLKRLRTDWVDLYQLHAITDKEDIEKIFGPGGAMETFVKAREQGKVRFLGFSAHSVEAALAAMDRFEFDSVLFPLNFVTWFKGDFGPQVVEKAHSKGMGILALKAGARGKVAEGAKKPFEKCWYEPLTDPAEITKSFHFTLSLPVTACLPPGEEKLWRMALDAGRRFMPVARQERQDLKTASDAVDPLFAYPAWQS